MVMRRCPKCGTTSYDQYGFCIRCGHEFPQVNPEANNCHLCGFENPDEAVFCVKCGAPLIFNKDQLEQKPIIIKYTANSTAPEKKEQYKPTSKWIIVLGYIFSIFGFFAGIPGLIIAIYLCTRKDPSARKHGYIQIAIVIIYLIILIVLFGTGQVSMSEINQIYNNASMQLNI